MTMLDVVVGLVVVFAWREVRELIARRNRNLWPVVKPVFGQEEKF